MGHPWFETSSTTGRSAPLGRGQVGRAFTSLSAAASAASAVVLTDTGARFRERGEPMGRLVVSAPQAIWRMHAAPLICAFMRRHPTIRGDSLLSDRFTNLVDDGIGVAIRIGHQPDSGEVARKVGAARHVLVASPGYLERVGIPTAPADLAGHRLIARTARTPTDHSSSGRRADRPMSPWCPPM